ncbi:MAG: hypothetical protein S0880_27265 [Actinomycetota bacterium]|nr:hypothetical protein [Actinomycetota bacterium]
MSGSVLLVIGVPHRLVDGRGIAHVVGHLVANGPADYRAFRFWPQLVERGRIESFATIVRRSFTAYAVRCRPGDVEPMRDLLVDSLLDVPVDVGSLAAVTAARPTVGTVRDELALRAGGIRSLSKDLVGRLHRGTPLEHDPAGTVATRPTIDGEEVRNHVERWHHPAQWCIAVVDGEVVLTERPQRGLEPVAPPLSSVSSSFDAGAGVGLVGAAWAFGSEGARAASIGDARARAHQLRDPRTVRQLARVGLRPAAAPLLDPVAPFPVVAGVWFDDGGTRAPGEVSELVEHLSRAAGTTAVPPEDWWTSLSGSGAGPDVDRALLAVADRFAEATPARPVAPDGADPVRRHRERGAPRCDRRQRPLRRSVDDATGRSAEPAPARVAPSVPGEPGVAATDTAPAGLATAEPGPGGHRGGDRPPGSVRMRCYHPGLDHLDTGADGLRISSGVRQTVDAELPYLEVEIGSELVGRGTGQAAHVAAIWATALGATGRREVGTLRPDREATWSVAVFGDVDGAELRSWIALVRGLVDDDWARLVRGGPGHGPAAVATGTDEPARPADRSWGDGTPVRRAAGRRSV